LEVLDAVSVVVVLPPEVVPSELRRVIVGRSGSSAGVPPVCVVDAVVVVEVSVVVPSGLRRFMVGRSGSSAGVDALLAVDEVSEVVVDGVVAVPELAVSELRRFMVGRSGSLLVDVSVVLVVVGVPDFVSAGVAGVLWPPVGVVESPPGFEPKWGLFDEVVMTGSVLDGFRAAVVLLGAASGLTLP
jgi:hypothetical protein